MVRMNPEGALQLRHSLSFLMTMHTMFAKLRRCPDGETERQRGRQTERQRDSETERQRDRYTERQVYREPERQRYRETEIEIGLER